MVLTLTQSQTKKHISDIFSQDIFQTLLKIQVFYAYGRCGWQSSCCLWRSFRVTCGGRGPEGGHGLGLGLGSGEWR